MGSNPSRFVDPERPVENVSFDDVEAFLARIDGLRPGLGLRLPTEVAPGQSLRPGGGKLGWRSLNDLTPTG